MTERLALVQCSATKRDERSPAYALYSSTFFETLFGAAMHLGDPAILSAEHGFVRPDDRLDPYDETLRGASEDEKWAWGRRVVGSIPECYDEWIVLAGRDYAAPVGAVVVERELDVDVVTPFYGMSGNGKMMGWATDTIDQLQSGTPIEEVLP